MEGPGDNERETTASCRVQGLTRTVEHQVEHEMLSGMKTILVPWQGQGNLNRENRCTHQHGIEGPLLKATKT